MGNAIEVTELTKTFGDGENTTTILDKVTLHVEQGEFLMLVGPSGSGKTTLLSLIGCALRATSGSIRLYGSEITTRKDSELPQLRRSHIGFIFQGHNLIASMTTTENIVFQMQMRGLPHKQSVAEAHHLLDRVGLGDKREARPRDLSGGQRQRVAIARAIAGRPPIILADEPTASLDHKSGALVTELLRDLAGELGHTVVVVTHDSRIFDLADRIEHLEDGKLQRAGEPPVSGRNPLNQGGLS